MNKIYFSQINGTNAICIVRKVTFDVFFLEEDAFQRFVLAPGDEERFKVEHIRLLANSNLEYIDEQLMLQYFDEVKPILPEYFI